MKLLSVKAIGTLLLAAGLTLAGVVAPAHAAINVTINTPVPTFTANTASPAFSVRAVNDPNAAGYGGATIDITKSDLTQRWTFNSTGFPNCPSTLGTSTTNFSDCGVTLTQNVGSGGSITVYVANNQMFFIFFGSTLTDVTFNFAPGTWSNVRDAGTYNFNSGMQGASTSITVAAAVPTFTVTFDGNSSTGGATAAQTASSAAALTSNGFTRTGYTFGGWATSQANATAGTVAYADGAMYNFTAATTLYAIWTANSNSGSSGGAGGGSSSGSSSSASSDTGLATTGLSPMPYLLTGGVLTLLGFSLILLYRPHKARR